MHAAPVFCCCWVFSTIIFCFIMHMFFIHLNICVALRVYSLENMYMCIYSMYPSGFIRVCCMVQLLCIGLSKASTFKTRKLCHYHAVSYLIQNTLAIYYFLFCLFLTECCAIQCLCLPLLSSKHALFLFYRRHCRIFDELLTWEMISQYCGECLPFIMTLKPPFVGQTGNFLAISNLHYLSNNHNVDLNQITTSVV